MKAAIAIVVAVAIGGVVFIAIEFGSVGEGGVGVKSAAACTEASPRCLPSLTLIDTAGQAWTREVLEGKVVFVNFWATWCKPCIKELPALAAFRARHPDIVLLGVLEDDASKEVLDGFMTKHGVTWPVVRGDDDLMAAFEYPQLLPTTFVYDRSGHLRFKEADSLDEARLEELLADAAKTP